MPLDRLRALKELIQEKTDAAKLEVEHESNPVPVFAREEILESRFFSTKDVVTIRLTDGDWLNPNGLARLTLLHAISRTTEKETDGLTARGDTACLLDCCQLLDITPDGAKPGEMLTTLKPK